MTIDAFELALNLVAVSGTLAFGVLAVSQRNLVRSVVAYGVASAFLAMLFFLLASPFAALLELTVGSGLIIVLFLVALTLSMGVEGEGAEGGGS